MPEPVDWITVLVWFATRPRDRKVNRPQMRFELSNGNPDRLRDLAVLEALLA